MADVALLNPQIDNKLFYVNPTVSNSYFHPIESRQTSYQSLNRSRSNLDKTVLLTINSLPKNVLLEIFSYLSEKELGRTVLQVCRKWKHLGKSPEFWRSLSFANDEVPMQTIFNLLRSSPKLKRISLFNMTDTKTIIRQFCRCNPELEYVTIRYCTKTEALHEPVLKNILISCKNIKMLDLKGSSFLATKFYQDLSSLTNLKSINFGDNPYLRIQDILTVALNCRSLEELNLSRHTNKSYSSKMDNDDAVFLFANLAKRLKVLKFDCMNLTEPAFESILRCSHLEYLCLFNANSFGNLMFRNLWGYVPKIKKLKLTKATLLTSNDFFHLFTVGRNVMKNLEVIDISGGWKITDRALEAIAECCNVNLKKLNIRNCKNIKNISCLFRRCPNIKYLNISHSVKLVNNVSAIPKCLPSLQTLIIDSESKTKLVNKLPKESNMNIFVSLSEYNNNREIITCE